MTWIAAPHMAVLSEPEGTGGEKQDVHGPSEARASDEPRF